MGASKNSVRGIPFRPSFVTLPVIILAVTLLLTAYFARLLPPSVAYRFSDRVSEQFIAREVLLVGLLLPQFLLTAMAGALVFGVSWLSRRFPEIGAATVSRVLSVMGNMFALPQLILGFVLLDIFIYNSYQRHIMSLLAFALAVMGVGVVVIGAYLFLAVRQAGAASPRS